ncbi:MAG TPA: type II secretion system protein GspM [Acetobacteraceae bacterium]|nr:type II secretion system protein GspM [Acetobacteraceae bacterium]
MTLDLPTGPRGRILALALTLIAFLVVWFGIIGPALAWYSGRAERLDQRLVLARRMADLAASLPQLERQVAALPTTNANPNALLPGESDAVAAAALQERVQEMASRAGAPLSSVEMLQATQLGQFRRIGLRVAAQAEMGNVIHLLESIQAAKPRMLIDELDLQRHLMLSKPNVPELDAKFIVYSFRAGGAAAGPARAAP